MPTEPHPQPAPPAWLIGLGTLTFGFVAGFIVTALPFLLSRTGVSVDRIAAISATAMSPTFWAFLVTPIVDVGFSRRFYAFALTAAAALNLGAALWFFSPHRLSLFTGLLLVAELCIVLQSSAVNGWISEFVEDGSRGKVGGWTNAANLGGGAFGSMLIMWSAPHLAFRTLGALLALAVLGSSLFLLYFPRPVRPVLGTAQIFGGTFRSVIQTSRQSQVLTGFALFLAPASCVAAINLFSSLGSDFQTTPERVVWVTGVGAAFSSALGSVIGGYLADRVNRGALYLTGGALAGLCALTLAWTSHTEVAFTAGALVYNGIAGVSYAAFTALGLQLVGSRNPTAATQMGLFAAATNGAIVYMTWADGQGYRLSGVRGLFLMDGLASIGAAIPLLLFLRWRERRNRLSATDAVNSSPEDDREQADRQAARF